MSIAVPTGKPAISRPRENRSSMANSSATRIGGLYERDRVAEHRDRGLRRAVGEDRRRSGWATASARSRCCGAR